MTPQELEKYHANKVLGKLKVRIRESEQKKEGDIDN